MRVGEDLPGRQGRDADVDLFLFRLRFDQFAAVLQTFVEITGGKGQGPPLHFELRQGQKIADQGGEPFRMVFDDIGKALGGGGIFADQAAAQGFGITTDDGDRGAQFMGDIGDKIAANGFEAFNLADIMKDGNNADQFVIFEERDPVGEEGGVAVKDEFVRFFAAAGQHPPEGFMQGRVS